MAHYIKGIKQVFDEILGGDSSLMELTDEVTVEEIRLRAPALSRYDAESIQNQMAKGNLFPKILDPSIRQGIASRLLAIKQLIRTIHTLFKDLRYLYPALGMIRGLIPKVVKGTLCQALHHHFSPDDDADGSIEIQLSIHSYSPFSGSSEQLFDLAVRQLFLSAIRSSAKPYVQRVEIYATFELAELAERLGFSTDEITSALKNDPYQAMVLDLLKRIQPNCKAIDIQSRVQSMARELRELVDTVGVTEVERFVPWATVAGLGEPRSRRCGPVAWPSTSDRESEESDDVNNIFLGQMHLPLAELQKAGQGISSFYVKQSIYLAFFGDLESDERIHSHLGTNDGGQRRAPSVDIHRTLLSNQRATSISGLGRDPNSHISSQGTVTCQVVPFTGQLITFMEDDIPVREVPYEKDSVNFVAREYADQGKKLHVPEGPHFIWEHCYDILAKTGSSTVLVTTVLRQMNRKRHHDKIIPGQFPHSDEGHISF